MKSEMIKTEAFITGNKVRINNKGLIVHGCTATITRWHHDDVYTAVILDRGLFCGREVVVKAGELERVKS